MIQMCHPSMLRCHISEIISLLKLSRRQNSMKLSRAESRQYVKFVRRFCNWLCPHFYRDGENLTRRVLVRDCTCNIKSSSVALLQFVFVVFWHLI